MSVCAEPLEMEVPAPTAGSTIAAMPPSHSEHDEVMSADDETWNLVKDCNNAADIDLLCSSRLAIYSQTISRHTNPTPLREMPVGATLVSI